MPINRITIVTSLLPYPLNSGGAQAQYNFIDQLRTKYDISIIFPENGVNTIRSMKVLAGLWPEVTFYPYSYINQLKNFKFLCDKVKRAFDLKFRKNNINFKVERILKPYGCEIDKRFISFVNKVLEEANSELLQIDFYPHIGLIRHINKHIKTVFIHHEIRYVRNKRMLSQLNIDAEKMRLYKTLKDEEIQNLNLYDTVVTLTDVDNAILRNDGVTTNIKTSPAAISSKVTGLKEWNGKFAFVGAASHGPNQEGIAWVAEKVLPLIDWTKYPNAEFDIVGKGWQGNTVNFPCNLKVKTFGFVENLHDVIDGSIMVVPILSGSGMRMKILEGSALGLPIITTTIGMEGLKHIPGRDCIVADEPEDFANSLEELFVNCDKRKNLAINAQAIFKEYYSLEKMSNIRSAIYEELLTKLNACHKTW